MPWNERVTIVPYNYARKTLMRMANLSISTKKRILLQIKKQIRFESNQINGKILGFRIKYMKQNVSTTAAIFDEENYKIMENNQNPNNENAE